MSTSVPTTQPTPLLLSFNIPFRLNSMLASERPSGRATFLGDHAAKAAYLDALQTEFDAAVQRGDFDGMQVEAVRIGGGCPSIMSGDRLGALAARVRRALPLPRGCEFDVEALPHTVCTPSLTGWAQGPITSVSLRVGSVQAQELTRLGASYTVDDVQNAVLFLDKFHVGNVELVLTAGIPGQTSVSWKQTLRACMNLESQRVRIEPFFGLAVNDAAADEAAELFAFAQSYLAERGFAQYACNRFALPNRQSAFDRLACEGCDVLELGADAHSLFGGFRTASTPDFDTYVNNADSLEDITVSVLEEDELARRARTLYHRLSALEKVAVDELAPEERAHFEALEQRGLVQREAEPTGTAGTYRLSELGMLFLPTLPLPNRL